MNLERVRKGYVLKISAGTVPMLFKWVTATQYSGRIIFRRGQQSCSFFFKEGDILNAKTNDPEQRLGAVLQKALSLDENDINAALKLSRASEEPLGMVLLKEKIIQPHDLYKGLVCQVELMVKAVELWNTGICYLHPGVSPGRSVVLLKVPLLRMILKGSVPALKGQKAVDGLLSVKEAHKDFKAPVHDAKSIEEFISEKEAVPENDYYGILGVKKEAGLDEIKNAYQKIVKSWHPDRLAHKLGKASLSRLQRISSRINEAYSVLGDEKRRKDYDREIKESVPGKKREEAFSLTKEAKRLYRASLPLMKNGEYFRAAEYLRKACQMDPNRAEYFYYLGAAFYKKGRSLKQAEEALYRAIELDGSCPDYYLALGQVYKAGKLYSRAMDLFKRALEWEPKNRQALKEKASLEKLLKKKS